MRVQKQMEALSMNRSNRQSSILNILNSQLFPILNCAQLGIGN